MNALAASVLMNLAAWVARAALLLFGAFLVWGPFISFHLTSSESHALLWNGALSMVFFLQHSGMIRGSFRAWLSSRIPPLYHATIYALVSGIALVAVVVLWQKTPTVLWEIHGPVRGALRAAPVLAVLGLIWGVRSIPGFDPFGRLALRRSLCGKPVSSPSLTLRGPYLWVRHPLYFFSLTLIWAVPDLSLGRLLFNTLWTVWIILGTHLEERDLVTEFGDRYRRYQATVPMLVPWRGPVGRQMANPPVAGTGA